MTEPQHGYGDSHSLDFPALPELGAVKPEPVSPQAPEQFEPGDFTD